LLFCAALLGAVPLPAIGQAPPPPRPVRIVALAPSVAEILFALGAADRVVGVSDFAADLPEAKGKMRVGGFEPSREFVVGLRPDLVVVSRDGTASSAVGFLQDWGVPVLITGGFDLDGVLDDIQAVGRAIGEEARAAKLVADLRGRAEAAGRRAASRKGPRLSAIALIWPDPPVVAGPRTFVGDLLRRAGLDNPAPERGGSAGAWPRVSHETIAGWNPSLVIRPDTKENAAAFRKSFGEDPRWKVVPAVRDGHVVPVPGNWLERPGPRLVDALERIVDQLVAR